MTPPREAEAARISSWFAFCPKSTFSYFTQCPCRMKPTHSPPSEQGAFCVPCLAVKLFAGMRAMFAGCSQATLRRYSPPALLSQAGAVPAGAITSSSLVASMSQSPLRYTAPRWCSRPLGLNQSPRISSWYGLKLPKRRLGTTAFHVSF